MFNRCLRIDIEPNTFQQHLGSIVQGSVVNKQPVPSWQTVKQQVLRHGKKREEIKFLVNHSDAGFQRVEGGGGKIRQTDKSHLPCIVRIAAPQELDQGRFPCAI